VTATAKAQGLPQEKAQQLMDTTIAEIAAYSNSVKVGMERTMVEWQNFAKADKEIGGDNHTKSLELGKKVLTTFGSEKLIKDLAATGFGNHPELIRLFKRIGESMKEADFLNGNSVQGQPKSAAEKLYDNETSQPKA
jgi:hypothetical protein